jgi:hypothetical protein
MSIKPSQAQMYPKVSDWYETNVVEYRENSAFDKWYIEAVYFEADAEYSYGSDKKHVMSGGYQKVEITDKLNGNFWEEAFLGETAHQDVARWANDIVNKIKYGKVKS